MPQLTTSIRPFTAWSDGPCTASDWPSSGGPTATTIAATTAPSCGLSSVRRPVYSGFSAEPGRLPRPSQVFSAPPTRPGVADARIIGESRSARARLMPGRTWLWGGAIGLGTVGAAVLAAAPGQAAPVEFPDWATVTGTIPDDAGLDRSAADANDWTFSWSTDANGVVTFAYADGSTSNSADPPGPGSGLNPGDLSVQSTPSPLWTTSDPGADPASPTADGGMENLAAAVSAPFGGDPIQSSTEAVPQAVPHDAPAPGELAPAPSASSGNASDQSIVDTAHHGLGGAYVWGGTDYMAWDCSGYVQWVYAQNGISIPRVTWDQFAAGTPTTSPRPGDLVSQNGGSHVGIYLGGDQMISALNPQEGTIVHSVHAMPLDGYYTYR